MTTKTKKKAAAPARSAKSASEGEGRVAVTPRNLQLAAARLIPNPLVSVEVSWLQKTLGTSATQAKIDQQIIAVRKMPWTSIEQ